MRSRAVICTFAWVTLSVCSNADVQLAGGTVIHFASVSEGSKILMTRDDFIRRLSPFDRAARLEIDRAVSEEEFLTFVGRNVSDWKGEEIHTLETAIEGLRPLLRQFSISLPSTIQVIKTTGAEEGNAPYTR